jgi:hypothetical protein
MGVVKVEIPLEEDVAAELTDDPVRPAAVGQLVSRLVRPTEAEDPLGRLLDDIGRKAELAGLTQQDIDQELAAWKAERAARRR